MQKCIPTVVKIGKQLEASTWAVYMTLSVAFSTRGFQFLTTDSSKQRVDKRALAQGCQTVQSGSCLELIMRFHSSHESWPSPRRTPTCVCCLSPLNAVLKPKHMGAVRASHQRPSFPLAPSSHFSMPSPCSSFVLYPPTLLLLTLPSLSRFLSILFLPSIHSFASSLSFFAP